MHNSLLSIYTYGQNGNSSILSLSAVSLAARVCAELSPAGYALYTRRAISTDESPYFRIRTSSCISGNLVRTIMVDNGTPISSMYHDDARVIEQLKLSLWWLHRSPLPFAFDCSARMASEAFSCIRCAFTSNASLASLSVVTDEDILLPVPIVSSLSISRQLHEFPPRPYQYVSFTSHTLPVNRKTENFLTHLQTLQLSKVSLLPETLTYLAVFPLLRVLHLSSTDLSSALSISTHCPELEELDVSACTRLQDLRDLAALPWLCFIEASHSAVNTLDGLALCPRLQVLRVCFCQKLSSLLGLAGAPALTTLKASSCPLVDIADIGKCVVIQEVDLCGYDRVMELGMLANCPALRTINISETAVCNVTALAQCTSLEVVWLSECVAPTDMSPFCTFFPAFGTGRLLRYVNLSFTGISDLYPLVSTCPQFRTDFCSKLQRTARPFTSFYCMASI